MSNVNVCENCQHGNVCKLRKMAEKVLKQLDDSLKVESKESEEFKQDQFSVKLECKDFLSVNRGYVIPSTTDNWSITQTGQLETDHCSTCPNNPKNIPIGTIGDSPCTFCQYNKWKITCVSSNATTTGYCATENIVDTRSEEI